MDWLLPILVFLPLLFSVLIPFAPLGKDGEIIKIKALVTSLILLALSGFAWVTGALIEPVSYEWLPQFGITFSLGSDGVSLTLATLTAFLSVMAVISSFKNITSRHKLYYSLLFLLIGSVMGVFLSRDLFLFFLFFELELIPMYLLIAQWGGPRRNYAAMKFVLYTLFGSVFLVASMLGLYFLGQSSGAVSGSELFHFDEITRLIASGDIGLNTQILLFLGFFIAFAVKLPVVPFHTWLPDAHVEAPTPISMLLAGILLKMGAYGMLRFGFEWFPQAAEVIAPYIGLLAVINIVYTAGIALVQKDMKKLIAYSSVSHMGFVLLALAALNATGMNAAVFVMISHGLVSAALFMGVGTLYRRTHSRLISDYGGVAQKMPFAFYFFLLMSMASLGLPLLISFAGESLVFYGAYVSDAFQSINLFGYSLPLSIQGVAAISAIGVVLGAAYMLWLVKRLFMGELSEKAAKLTDLSRSEILVMASLSLLVIYFGFFPNRLSQQYEATTAHIAAPFEASIQTAKTPNVSSTPLLSEAAH